jgi:glutathione peroxidase
MSQFYDLSFRALDGTTQTMAQYRGKVLLLVNTASRCGFTPQYSGLEALYRSYGPDDFTVIGFPCNQFLRQEPDDEGAIQQFCTSRFDVTFPLASKINVNGPDTHPIFAWLKQAAPGLAGSRAIKWNFTKFVVNRDASKVMRFAPRTEPRALAHTIEEFLHDRS